MDYIRLTAATIGDRHICCAFSDTKCAPGYEAKKRWLTARFDEGYVFRRLDERAKVFIEYGPADRAWVPVTAPNYMMIGCFWVSGRYKGHGHGKALLRYAIDDAKDQGMAGLVAVVGTTKYHFMGDTKWLLGQGFQTCDTDPAGFSLISLELGGQGGRPRFGESVRSGRPVSAEGIVVYHSDRCPYCDHYVRETLAGTARARGMKLTIVKLETMEAARSCPSPATIFSMYLDGVFVTTDIGVCLDGRFDSIVGKHASRTRKTPPSAGRAVPGAGAVLDEDRSLP